MSFQIPVIVNVTFTTGSKETFLASHVLYEDWEELELSNNKEILACSSEMVKEFQIDTGNSMLVITLEDPE